MVRLGDFLGGVLIQVDRGRSQADAASVELAAAYRGDPILAEFPVPRVSVAEVVLDVKLAVSGVATSRAVATRAAQERLFEQFAAVWRELPQREVKVDPLVARGVWEEAGQQTVERLTNVLPVGAEIDARAAASVASALFAGELATAVFARPVDELGAEDLEELRRAWPGATIERRLRARFIELIEAEVRESSDPNAVEVLVTEEELREIAPERVTQMRLTLQQDDRAWTRYETAAGETQYKLVPD